MPLFSRRVLQRLLIQSGSLFAPGKRRALARALNGKNFKNALAAEWELVVGVALSAIGLTQSEPRPAGTRPIDFVTTLPSGVAIGLEVTAVSDQEHRQSNPDSHFCGEFLRILRGRISTPFALDFHLGTELDERGRKVVAIPTPRAHDDFFHGSDFREFCTRVERDPLVPASMGFGRTRDNSSTATYKPGELFGSTRFSDPTYDDTSPGLRTNSIWRRLKKKSDQIKDSGFEGPVGVLLCDAGHSLFARSSLDSKSLEEIIAAFLREYGEVSFVGVLRTRNLAGKGRAGELPTLSLHKNKSARFPCPPGVLEDLQALELHLPKLERDGINARQYVARHLGMRGRTRRGLMVSYGSGRLQVTVPAQDLLEALASPVALNAQLRRWRPVIPEGASPISPFAPALNAGMRLVAVELINLEDEDGDLLCFSFEGNDPALGPIDAGADFP